MMKCDCSCMQIMQGEQGVVAHVKLPPREELDQYDKLELYFTLGCPGMPYLCLPRVSAIDTRPRLKPHKAFHVQEDPPAAETELHHKEAPMTVEQTL